MKSVFAKNIDKITGIVFILLLLICSCRSQNKPLTASAGEIVKKTYISPRNDSVFFSMLNLDFQGMEEVRNYVLQKDYKNAEAAYLEFRRTKSNAKWDINPADKPQKASADSYPQAEKIMKHLIEPSMGAPETFVGEDINWEYNPVDTSQPNFTKEWTYANLNRMPMWNTLGHAYWQTLDEKYAKEWVSQLIDWVKDNPVPLDASPGETLTWRTIEAGIRMSGSWMNAYYYFLNSSSFTPEAHKIFVTGVIEHAQRLEKITLEMPERSGNWITMECNGLGTIGILFPEFKHSAELLNVAFERLNKELNKQVYPDGAEVELTPGYHQVSRSNFMRLAKLALKNNVQLPEGYMDKMKKQYLFNLYMMDPSGYLPPFNDSNPVNAISSLREAYEIWKDEEFLFGATMGKEGKKPPFDSYYFNWAGYYIMRSGWNFNDNCLYFDAGPVGYAHEHEDMLNIYLYSHGKILITEPGSYSYDQSIWRHYVLSSPGHNTILVDGKEQHRGDMKEARLITKPYDNPWTTSALFDYGRGIYSSGYQENRYKMIRKPKEYVGEKDTSVIHTRHVVFLKPYYYVVVDFLTGEGIHTYEAHFHLNAPDAVIDRQNFSVHTLCDDSVQLALYPMDIENMEGKIVTGQLDPILGWLPREHRKIPTVVYVKRGEVPVTFSTFLYPYLAEKPEFTFTKTMKNNSTCWAENISTKYETASVLIFKNPVMKPQEINTGTTSPFSALADVIVIRIPKNGTDEFLGFSGLSEYNDEKLSFKLKDKLPLLVLRSGTKNYLYYPGNENIEITFNKPLKKKISIPGNQWVGTTDKGVTLIQDIKFKI